MKKNRKCCREGFKNFKLIQNCRLNIKRNEKNLNVYITYNTHTHTYTHAHLYNNIYSTHIDVCFIVLILKYVVYYTSYIR